MTTTVLSEYNYCKICSTNYPEGKHHVYSKKHKDISAKIIDKFITRISDGLKILEIPVVNNNFNDASRKFWCYACEIEVIVHQKQDTVLLHFAGMINHLSSLTHLAKLKTFFRINGLDRSLLSHCYITQDKMAKYMSQSSNMKNQLIKYQKEKLQMEAKHIEELDAIRKSVVESGTKFVVKTNRPKASFSQEHLPPWLQDEDDDNNNQIIGPTKEDFDNHVRKKPKLPEGRVGAGFDRSSKSKGNWLPAFGRVWNHGRRLKSKQEFSRKWKKN